MSKPFNGQAHTIRPINTVHVALFHWQMHSSLPYSEPSLYMGAVQTFLFGSPNQFCAQ
jgi:hypothetical protein